MLSSISGITCMLTNPCPSPKLLAVLGTASCLGCAQRISMVSCMFVHPPQVAACMVCPHGSCISALLSCICMIGPGLLCNLISVSFRMYCSMAEPQAGLTGGTAMPLQLSKLSSTLAPPPPSPPGPPGGNLQSPSACSGSTSIHHCMLQIATHATHHPGAL